MFFIFKPKKYLAENLNIKNESKCVEIFIFILSGGILESQWCIKELRSAIEAKKEIVIIRDISYKLPDLFPIDLQDIEEVIRKAKTITWMAEYNTSCVEKIKGKEIDRTADVRQEDVLGPSDAFIESVESWMKQPENAVEAQQILSRDIGSTRSFNLSNWSGDINSFLLAYVVK